MVSALDYSDHHPQKSNYFRTTRPQNCHIFQTPHPQNFCPILHPRFCQELTICFVLLVRQLTTAG